MSITIPKSKINPPVNTAPGNGPAKRPASSTSPRAGFAAVLEGQGAVGRILPPSENAAGRQTGEAKISQTRIGRNMDTGFAVSPSRSSGVGPLEAAVVTSTLLRLNALTAYRVGAAPLLSSGTLERPLAPLARMAALRSVSAVRASPALSDALGSLSTKFESGEAGVGAIGYDRQGGTSYGVYQISSRAGTMSDFLAFLDERAPEWARKLRAAGPADTGGKDGAMPRQWLRIAAEDPDRFAGLQRDFIERTHYLPAVDEIRERTGIDMKKQPRALQEVLWSTAVQHGAKGAAKLFCRVIGQEANASSSALPAHRVIEEIYAERADQFGSSSSPVRAAVRKRFEEERQLALGMLNAETRRSRAIG